MGERNLEKLAIISDIHSNIVALDSVLEHIRSQACVKIVCCGDLAGYGPRPNEVINRIRELNIPTIMGNYDEAVGFLLPVCGCNLDDKNQKRLSNNSLKWSIANTTEENRKFLRSLPESFEIEFAKKKIVLLHSTFDSINEYIYEEDLERINEILEDFEQDIYIYGHTHFPFVKYVKDKLIINAGSVGRPKNFDNRGSYIMLEHDGNKIDCSIYFVEYDIELVSKEIEISGLDSYFADFLRCAGDVDKCCEVNLDCKVKEVKK